MLGEQDLPSIFRGNDLASLLGGLGMSNSGDNGEISPRKAVNLVYLPVKSIGHPIWEIPGDLNMFKKA